MIDSLKHVLQTAGEDSVKANIVNALIEKKWIGGNFEKTKGFINEVLTIISAMKQSDIIKRSKAKLYYTIGDLCTEQGTYPDALKNFLSSIRIQEEIGNKKDVANCYSNIGIIYQRQENFPEAVANFSTALKISSEIGDKKGIARAHSGIGMVYLFQGDAEHEKAKKELLYAEALKEHRLALKIREELADKKAINSSHIWIGNVYWSKHSYPEALREHFSVLKASEEIGDQQSIFFSHYNLGGIFYQQGDFVNSANQYSMALTVKNGNCTECYINIAIADIKLKKYSEAKLCLNKALEKSTSLGQRSEARDTYRSMFELDSAQQNYKDALTNYKIYVAYKDSLNNEGNTKKMVQSQMNYEFEKKEQASRMEQEKKDVMALEEKNKQVIVRNSFIGGFVIVLLMALLILRGYRNKQKANHVIFLQKKDVENAKNIIEEQKLEVEEKQKEILDSIYYAKRIQMALITNEKYIDKNLNRLTQNKSHNS